MMQPHFLGHGINIRSRSIVNHGIGKHEIDIPLKLERARNDAIFHLHLDTFKIHGTLDDLVVVRCLGGFDRIVEDIPVPMLRNLGVQHGDNILKTFLFFSTIRPATSARDTRAWTWMYNLVRA